MGMMIPDADPERQIAEAYSRGEMLVEVLPRWKDRFLMLYEQISHLSRNQTQNAKQEPPDTKHQTQT